MEKRLKYLASNGALILLIFKSQEGGSWFYAATGALCLFLTLGFIRTVVGGVFLSWIKSDPDQLKDEMVVRSIVHIKSPFGKFIDLVFDTCMVGMIYVHTGYTWSIVWVVGALFNVLADEISRDTHEYCKEASTVS